MELQGLYSILHVTLYGFSQLRIVSYNLVFLSAFYFACIPRLDMKSLRFLFFLQEISISIEAVGLLEKRRVVMSSSLSDSIKQELTFAENTNFVCLGMGSSIMKLLLFFNPMAFLSSPGPLYPHLYSS